MPQTNLTLFTAPDQTSPPVWPCGVVSVTLATVTITPKSRFLILRAFALTLAATLMIACAQEASPTPDESFVVADLFATPGKSLATAELTPTTMPSATLANIAPTAPATLPLPTVIILREPTSPLSTLGPSPTPIPASTATPTPLACPTPPLPFGAVWQNNPRAQSMMRCAVGEVQTIAGVWQTFEHGVMFWRGSDRSIFVISDLKIRQGQATDSWWRVVDTWVDGEPESDPALVPPAGMRQPIRGFGKIWRANGFIREALGWATSDEFGFDSLWLQFEGGWMMTGPNQTPVYVMVPIDAPPYTSGTHIGPQQ